MTNINIDSKKGNDPNKEVFSENDVLRIYKMTSSWDDYGITIEKAITMFRHYKSIGYTGEKLSKR